MDNLLPKHGGYRNLVSFKLARLVYDISVRFTRRFIGSWSRTIDQMVQSARSGVQNIAEGSQASGTSKKTEITLTNVARSSLEELVLDYEDFLRHRRLPQWDKNDPRRSELVKLRPQDADAFALWVKKLSQEERGTVPEVAANGVLILLSITTSLLDNQIASQAEAFKTEGGFSERLYKYRKFHRDRQG